MSKRLKTGLVGAGVFAGYHANKLVANDRVQFIGVHDPDAERAENLAVKHGVDAMALSDLFGDCDAIIIACPASFHGGIAIQALEAGCHCLVEKPIATSLEDVEAIVALKNAKGLIVQIGHQERIVLRAIGLDQVDELPLSLRAERSNSYSPRGTDTSVTMDLMTHDIDLCTALFGRGPDHVEGQSVAVKSETADETWARLYYGEAVAELKASRIVETGSRRMTITYPSGDVTIDFNAKMLTHSTPFDLNENFADDDRAKDSLGAATDIFVCAVLDGTPVLVRAEDGAIAARAAIQIDEGK